jgi:hypothetical protein
MNTLIGLLMAFALAIAPGYVLADGNGESCATPQTLVPGYAYPGDTNNDGNPILAVGPIPSPANDHIYAFTATSANGFINMIGSDFDFAVYLLNGCTEPAAPAPLAEATANAHAVLAFSDLAVGATYYVVVTGNEEAGTGPDSKGFYSLYMPIPSAGANDGGASCAAAQPLARGRTYTGDTVFSNNFINTIGPLPSPGNDEVYSFTTDDVQGFLYIDSADYDFGVFVTNDCQASTGPPLVAVTGSAPALLGNLYSLTPGQTYYLIVTGDPSATVNYNGIYSLSTLPPPDVIFSDGFDGRD